MISPKQKKILAFPYSPYDTLICDGSIRTGKTSIMMVAFVDWAMSNFSGQRFGICGKTVGSATENIIIPYISMTYAKKRYTLNWRRSTKILEVRRGAKVNYFEVFGGKDESSYALIQGRTLAGVLLDEVVLMPQSFVNQALARCSVEGARSWFSCNPGNPQHWFKTEWIDKKKEHNALHLHFTLDDNPSLSEKKKEQYRRDFTGVFYDRYVRGLWVPAEGIIYEHFANNVNEYLIDDPRAWCRENNHRLIRIMIGVDFGGTKSATTFVAVGITNRLTVLALDQEWMDSNILDPDKLNKRFVEFVKRVTATYGEAQTRADSAESVLIRGIRNAVQRESLPCSVLNAKKMEINDRIKLVLLLMVQKRFYVARKCEHLIDALSTAIYDPNSYEDIRLDDGTSDIDSLDAMEYCLEPWYQELLKYEE